MSEILGNKSNKQIKTKRRTIYNLTTTHVHCSLQYLYSGGGRRRRREEQRIIMAMNCSAPTLLKIICIISKKKKISRRGVIFCTTFFLQQFTYKHMFTLCTALLLYTVTYIEVKHGGVYTFSCGILLVFFFFLLAFSYTSQNHIFTT